MSVKIESKGKLPDVGLAKKAILARATQNIRSLAIQKAPYDTGLLRKSISSRITPNYGKVGVDKNIPYARIQEYGGVIRPKNKPFLAWKTKGGKWVFTKKPVKIPAKPYLIPAYEKVRDELGGIITSEIEKTTK